MVGAEDGAQVGFPHHEGRAGGPVAVGALQERHVVALAGQRDARHQPGQGAADEEDAEPASLVLAGHASGIVMS
ncbi:hypothetical protein FOS14_04715 [Skermania sp. ID1734]|uniref:hypothetical protein n=1 Tax=Skermania sp. ID1734 TaxID=2597516 RepID=UPI0011802529|nr:hypothetical protein [Skermania sp. ID1734]TSE01060.1 hypothetical protein FOS14_04715 [Skermania sp. ID1734]